NTSWKNYPNAASAFIGILRPSFFVTTFRCLKGGFRKTLGIQPLRRDGDRLVIHSRRAVRILVKYTWSSSVHPAIQRFSLHILSSGLVRIRHYGILANNRRKRDIEAARAILESLRFRSSRVCGGCTHLSAKRDRNCFPQSSLEARPSKRSLSGIAVSPDTAGVALYLKS